jgi:hypothetical protein
MRIIKTFEGFSNKESYTFDELSQEAKNHAIQNEIESMDETMGDWWYEPIIEGETEKLKEEGFDDIDIQFTGFHSQGDGASFTAKVTDNEKFVNETLKMKVMDKILDNISISVTRIDSRHVHENTVRLDCEVDGEDEIDFFSAGVDIDIKFDVSEYCVKIDDVGEPWLKSRCKEIYQALNKEYDSYFEEDHIIADFKANDQKFDEDGNLI